MHPTVEDSPTLAELFAVFLRLALLGFGGPNAHLALMLEEVVEKRGWLTREEFLELMGVTNLLPGPNSSEMAIHVGYATRGVPGALVTGLTFLTPAFLMVTGLSALYFSYGTLPVVDPVLATLKPVVLAIILRAGVKLGRAAVTGALEIVLAVVGVAVAVLYGGWVVPVMLLGGLVTWAAWRRGPGSSTGPKSGPGTRTLVATVPLPLLPIAQSGVASLLAALPAWALAGIVHLGIGLVLFGGGYTLVVLLQPIAVEEYAWLTAGQFLDGVALTQAVPGPISTLAAFVGFAAAGVPGATLATAGIYLPAFAAVLIVAPRFARLREVAGIKAALRGVSAVVAGSLIGVALTLVPPAIPDLWAGLILAVAGVALASGRVGPLGLVVGGLAAGLVRAVVGQGWWLG
jgi:chromate transporter